MRIISASDLTNFRQQFVNFAANSIRLAGRRLVGGGERQVFSADKSRGGTWPLVVEWRHSRFGRMREANTHESRDHSEAAESYPAGKRGGHSAQTNDDY